jgi:hypothetical protein
MKFVECFDCQSFNGREKSGEGIRLAEHGFGRCAHEKEIGRYVSGSYPRECAKFVRGEDGEKRRAWVERKRIILTA